eukprot:m.63434 g.63434  ORF g.63434 m.63434 type:complete len:394 (+) comp7195_c0_seq2:433-1614(+)
MRESTPCAIARTWISSAESAMGTRSPHTCLPPTQLVHEHPSPWCLPVLAFPPLSSCACTPHIYACLTCSPQIVAPYTAQDILRAANHHLHTDAIRVVDVLPASPCFHARHSAVGREYIYRLVYPRAAHKGVLPRPIFEASRAWVLPGPPDMALMEQACAILQGRHDFSSFRGASCEAKSPVRSVDSITLRETGEGFFSPGMHGLEVRVCARAFLYHQVRYLVSTIAQVGLGKMKLEDVRKLIETPRTAAAPLIAPPDGLFLCRVNYDLVADAAALKEVGSLKLPAEIQDRIAAADVIGTDTGLVVRVDLPNDVTAELALAGTRWTYTARRADETLRTTSHDLTRMGVVAPGCEAAVLRAVLVRCIAESYLERALFWPGAAARGEDGSDAEDQA